MKPPLLAIDSAQGTVRRYVHSASAKKIEVKGEAKMPENTPANLGTQDGLHLVEQFRKTGSLK